MSDKFKLIEKCNSEDISHMKIYEDKEGKFRLKKSCPICNKKTACFCFEDIETAINDFEFNEHLYCDRDYLKELWMEQVFWVMIDDECGTNFTKMASKIINARASKCVESKKYINGIMDEGRKIIDGFTNKQIKNIINKIDIDYEFNGEICQI